MNSFKSVSAKDVPVVEFMYLVSTRMPGERYRRRPRSLLLCVDFAQRCVYA